MNKNSSVAFMKSCAEEESNKLVQLNLKFLTTERLGSKWSETTVISDKALLFLFF